VVIIGQDVHFAFTSAQPMTKNAVQKKCTETFRKYGAFQSSVVEALTPAQAPQSDPVPLPAVEVPAVVPVETLAIRSGVEAIKDMVKDLTPPECHAVAVYAALQSIRGAPMTHQLVTKNMFEKNAAAHIFSHIGAPLWNQYLAPHAAKATPPQGITCNCFCGCKIFTGYAYKCPMCNRLVCAHCHPTKNRPYTDPTTLPQFYKEYVNHGINIGEKHGGKVALCHNCAELPKYWDVPLDEPMPINGIKWYFNWPQHQNQGGPIDWVNPNRDVRMDPELLDITEVYKCKALLNKKRLVRPMLWESAFTVHCILAAPDGSSIAVAINLFCFNMNKQWKSHNIIKYITDWVSNSDTARDKYIGYVLNAPDNIPEPIEFQVLSELSIYLSKPWISMEWITAQRGGKLDSIERENTKK